jgi:hypothetical protein
MVTWEEGRRTGRILTILADFPGHYAIFLVEVVGPWHPQATYVLNSRDVSVL